MPESSFVLSLLWQSALLPFGLALLVLTGARMLRMPALASVIATAVGFLGSYAAAVGGQWSPVPKVALDWLPWIVVVGTVAAVALAEAPAVAGRALVALVAAAVVVWPAVGSIGWARAAMAVGVAGLVMALAWTAFARGREGGRMRPLLLAVVVGGGGLAVMLDSSQSVGRLGGALACALLACSLAASRAPFGPAASGLVVLVFGSLLLNAYLYAGFPLASVALLVIGLLAQPVLAGERRGYGRGHSAGRPLAAGVFTVLPVAVAVGMAVQAVQAAGGY